MEGASIFLCPRSRGKRLASASGRGLFSSLATA
jgi:hypothetical protein